MTFLNKPDLPSLSPALVALPYSSALHTSLAHAQGFSLMVARHNSPALKVNCITEDIHYMFWGPGEVIVDLQAVASLWATDIKLSVIISIHSHNMQLLEYPHKYASIFHAQKLYRVDPANSTERNYLVPAQFDLVDTCFCSR